MGTATKRLIFANSHDRQLLFWLNNDQEGEGLFDFTDPLATAYEADITPITAADNADNVISQSRDLEDFAPLQIALDPLLVSNTFNTADAGNPNPGQLSTTYRLLLEDNDEASLRLFSRIFNAGNTADTLAHVKDPFVSSIQPTVPYNAAIAPAFADTLDLAHIQAGQNYFLFEALGDAYGQGFSASPKLILETTVTYANGRTATKRNEVELDLRDIKELYTRWSINVNGPNDEDLRKTLPFTSFATPTAPVQQSQVTDAPFWSGEDTVVWVHGWNVDGGTNNDRKASNAETVFKRLYWEGFRGEFVEFDWPTFVNSEGPWSVDQFNFTYNPSDLQAWRSASALKEVLSMYRGPDEDLQPVHLIAHSMGNVVAGEALRQWTYDFPFNNEALVTSYTAMMAAISAGAYGDNGTENFTFSLRLDLYRYFEHGRNPPGDNGLVPLFVGADSAAEKRINFYNEDDRALAAWDYNNNNKMDNFDAFDSTVWDYNCDWTPGDGENINNDLFERIEESVNPEVRTALDLADDFSRPGPDAYEIFAFFARSAARALGTKSVAAFDSNIDLEQYVMPGGADRGANHSYQYNHDAAETTGLWSDVMDEAGIFSSFYTPPILVDPVPSQSSANVNTSAASLPVPLYLSDRGPYTPPKRHVANPSSASLTLDSDLLLIEDVIATDEGGHTFFDYLLAASHETDADDANFTIDEALALFANS